MLGIYCRTSREVELGNSTISQQKTAGIKFADENKMKYEIYEDEGKSGYKISDDELDPLNNRPAFTKLIEDIKDGKIDKVWVWEHSRLSRNNYASAFIFRTFEKYKITLYENRKQFDMNDPQIKFMRQMLDAVSEYERQLIVARTTRGLRKRIDEGKRSYPKLYGYRKDGKDDKGYTKWIPVESEIENYKYILKLFTEGKSLRKITYEIQGNLKGDERGLLEHAHFISRIIRGYQYTGYQLTVDGNEIYKRFRNNEIGSLQILLDRKYWVKSASFTLELISIEDWVKTCEVLQIRGAKMSVLKKGRLLRASRSMGTGLIECGTCNSRFYYKEQNISNKKGRKWTYLSYFHHQYFNSTSCKQKPKSFDVKYMDEIFKQFYFHYLLVFDDRNEQIQASLRNIKQTQRKIKEKIAKNEKEISKIEKRILKFKTVLDQSDATEEAGIIKVLSRQIDENETVLEDMTEELSKLKIDGELENEKFKSTEAELTYYDVKERINDWFSNLDVEEQRNELIRLINKCTVYGHYLIIDTGKAVFLFDIKKHEVFDMRLLDNLNSDKVYKPYYTKNTNRREARKHNDRLIHNIDLNKGENTRMRVFQYLIKTYKIIYDISEKDRLVSFAPLTGLMGLELETFPAEE